MQQPLWAARGVNELAACYAPRLSGIGRREGQEERNEGLSPKRCILPVYTYFCKVLQDPENLQVLVAKCGKHHASLCNVQVVISRCCKYHARCSFELQKTANVHPICRCWFHFFANCCKYYVIYKWALQNAANTMRCTEFSPNMLYIPWHSAKHSTVYFFLLPNAAK